MSRRILARNGLLPSLAPVVAALAVFVSEAPAQSGLVGRGLHVFDSRWNDETFVEISAGLKHTLARRGDGSVVAWGENGYGLKCEVPSLPFGVRYVEIDAGGGHSLALRSDGEVVAWGMFDFGACTVPPLPAGVAYAKVAAGGLHSAALRSDGTIVAWGRNNYGQCNVPALPPGLVYVDVATGDSHSLAKRSDGSVVAWGWNGYGQCDVPALPSAVRYAEISAGGNHSLARRSNGSAVAWGWNDQGQCNVPALPAGIRFVQVSAGSSHNVGRLSDGSVVAWGWNDFGQCELPQPPPGMHYGEVSAGTRHSLALLSDGRIASAGANSVFQRNVPELPRGTTFVEVATNGDGFMLTQQTIARLSDGSILSWGGGASQFPPLPAGVTYVEIDAGIYHGLARRSDGSIVTWGGTGSAPPLPPGMKYVQAAAGSGHSAAVRSDGSIVAWGTNTSGECNVPPLSPGMTYVSVTAGGMTQGVTPHWGNTVAIRSDGWAIAWGDDNIAPVYVPAPPTGVSYVEVAAGGWQFASRLSSQVTIMDVAAGYDHYVVLSSNGSLGQFGPLGEWNDFGQSRMPPLSGGLRYVEVAAGGNQTVARYEGCPTCEPPFCIGDGGGTSVPCPCGNNGAAGHGCDNSASTGGAKLTVRGSVEPDRVVLESAGGLESSLTIFLQGQAVLGTPVVFGDGTRCIGGTLERIGVKTAVGGDSRYPALGDLPIRARSAALGDPIESGTFRYYQTYYRDAEPGFCNPGPATFNASNAVMVRW